MTTPLPPAAYSRSPRTNGLAIATLVLGICGFALLPVILGHIALRQIRERGEAGSGLAIAGLVLGYIAVVGYAILFLIIVLSLTGAFVVGAR